MTRNETPSPDQGRRPRARMRPRAGRDDEQARPSDNTMQDQTHAAASPTAANHDDDQTTPSEYIALAEICNRLRMSPGIRDTMLQDAEFPAVHRVTAKHRLVRRSELEAYFATRWVTPPPATTQGQPILRRPDGRRLCGAAKKLDDVAMAEALRAKVARVRRQSGPRETLPRVAVTSGGRQSHDAAPEYLLLEEVAAQLCTDRTGVSRLLRRPGAPPILRLTGKHRVVRTSDVELWLARGVEQHTQSAFAGGRR